METVVIDFNKKERKPEVVFRGKIPNPGITGRFKFHRIWLELSQEALDKHVKINDPSQLFLLQHGNHLSKTLQDFPIIEDFYQYEVMVDTARIIDYDGQKEAGITIVVTLCRQMEKDDKATIRKDPIAVRLQFEKAQPDISITWKIRPEFCHPGVTYQEARLKFGILEIKNMTQIQYAIPIEECRPGIELELNDPEQRLPRHNLLSVDLTHPHGGKISVMPSFVSGGGRGDIILDPPSSFDDHRRNTPLVSGAGYRLRIEKLPPGQICRIPVDIDLQGLSSPAKQTTYTAIATLINRQPPREEMRKAFISEPFVILQDDTAVALKIQLNDRSLDPEKHEEIIELSQPFSWDPQDNESSTCFTLEIGNQAQSGSGIVYVRNLTIEPQYDAASPSKLDLPPQATGAENELTYIFLINDQQIGQLKTEYCFGGGQPRTEQYCCSFKHHAIYAIPHEVAIIRMRISFAYLIAPRILKEQEVLQAFESPKMFTREIVLTIERKLGAHWLAVDFGTSGIVAAFDDDTENPMLLDLQRMLAEVDRITYTPEEMKEAQTSFLSSDLLLRPNGTLDALNYAVGILRLSPPESLLVQYLEYIIPYLKALIGTEYLPNHNHNLDQYFYKMSEMDDPISFIVQPLRVETILSNAYRRLLGNFIRSQDGQQSVSEVQKLILTVPNTFAPSHTDLIRTAILEDPVIRQQFPRLRKEYLDFISESDAVACYYISKWPTINANRDDQFAYQPGTEYVLVYDMGAGTLDLTYLKIETTPDYDRTVSILGRLGKTTAGNYLDYIIASYLHTHHSQHQELQGNIFGVGMTIEDRTFQHRVKEFIRKIIKPKLDSSEKWIIAAEDYSTIFQKNIELDFQQLRENEDVESFKSFIRNNTVELFEQFFPLCTDPDDRTTNPDARTTKYSKGHVPLNTLLLSGRSMQLNCLCDAVINVLAKEWAVSTFYVPDLIETAESKDTVLKSVVAQGALHYALLYRDQKRSPIKIQDNHVHACYGVLYKNPAAPTEWRYQELLTPHTTPTTEKIDLRFTPVGYFVQSYSNDPAKDMNARNMAYITRIYRFTNNEVVGDLRNVPVGIDINQERKLIFSVGPNTKKPTDPVKMELEDSDTFKHSMWPYWG